MLWLAPAWKGLQGLWKIRLQFKVILTDCNDNKNIHKMILNKTNKKYCRKKSRCTHTTEGY